MQWRVVGVLQATNATDIIMSEKARSMVVERRSGRLGFRIARFRACFRAMKAFPASHGPHASTFNDRI